MRTLRTLAVVLLSLALVPTLRAEPLAPATRGEIDTLLSRLQSSGCRFNRNGTWHSATEARAHLLRKLDYLERRDAVHSTEQFIERAASGSSVSGKPYLVQCGNAAPVESKVWLTGELRVLRASGRLPPGPAR